MQNVGMEKQKKIMQKIRAMEAELAYATPTRAKRLTSEIVRLKATVFDLR